MIIYIIFSLLLSVIFANIIKYISIGLNIELTNDLMILACKTFYIIGAIIMLSIGVTIYSAWKILNKTPGELIYNRPFYKKKN